MTTRRRTHCLRRIILRAIVFLLLGAVVNVVVAWGCMQSECEPAPPTPQNPLDWTSVQGVRGELPPEFVKNDWLKLRGSDSQWVLVSSQRSHGFGARVETWDAGEGPSHWHLSETRRMFLRYTGWPFLSLRCEAYHEDGAMDLQCGWQLSGSAQNLILPLCPIWPGFAINTLFYAAILWLLFAAPGRVRRWRRIRRGLCAKCAYPIGTSDVCTECGAHINKKVKARGSMGLPHPAPLASGNESSS